GGALPGRPDAGQPQTSATDSVPATESAGQLRPARQLRRHLPAQRDDLLQCRDQAEAGTAAGAAAHQGWLPDRGALGNPEWPGPAPDHAPPRHLSENDV